MLKPIYYKPKINLHLNVNFVYRRSKNSVEKFSLYLSHFQPTLESELAWR